MKISLERMHKDIEDIKTDIALIKHILSEEGSLTEESKERLKEARAIPLSEYEELWLKESIKNNQIIIVLWILNI